MKKKTKSLFFRITVDVSNGKELKTSPFIVSYLLPGKRIKNFRFSVTFWQNIRNVEDRLSSVVKIVSCPAMILVFRRVRKIARSDS